MTFWFNLQAMQSRAITPYNVFNSYKLSFTKLVGVINILYSQNYISINI